MDKRHPTVTDYERASGQEVEYNRHTDTGMTLLDVFFTAVGFLLVAVFLYGLM